MSTSVRVARPSSLPPASDRFVVVEASAGTGKTFFLEHRVVDLILGGAELGQILLVTFTDKAVAELRMRIRDVLDRLSRVDAAAAAPADSAWEIDDAARTRLRAAVTAFDHAPIFTIHGFCNRVLIEDAFAANRLFEQQQVADEVAFDAAFTALVRERFAREQPERDLLEAYLEWGGTVDKLRDLLLACVRADATIPRRYNPVAAQAAGAKLRSVFGTAEKCAALLDTLTAKGAARYAPPYVAVIRESLVIAGERPAALLGAIDAMREEAGKLLKYLQDPRHARAAEAITEALAQMSLDEAIATELLPSVIERIGKDKAAAGQFDYNDMLDLVDRALQGVRGEDLARRLRARMPWVMIDEFQDTDPVQWRIFRRVWLDPEARGLTIVGDPKQAIYGFRGADVTTYLSARDELLRLGATRVSLDVNRRSTRPLVDAINEILVGQPLAPLLDKSITYETPVTASGDVLCDVPRAPLTVYELKGSTRDPQRAALAQAIGAEIERLRAAPPAWSSRGHAPSFSLGHVMVLTRSNKESLQIASALRARGLACALVESDRLFQTREAEELAAVLEAIALPRDRSARLRALRTRFFDVPWAELARVVDAPDHHPLIARLFDWAALARDRHYEALFRHLVEDSRFAERALVLGGGERAHVNTWHLIELLLEEVARSRCDLRELVVRLRRWIHEHEALDDERDVQRAETDADAVRILTIHKSKGLEAPYVFLYGCASKPPRSRVGVVRDAAGRTLWVAATDPAVTQRMATEQDAENQRLAYVALTRAQVRLYLPLYGEKAVDPDSTYWQIQRCIEPMVRRANALVESVAIDVGGDEPADAPPDALASFDVPAPPVVAALAPLAVERAGLGMLSYTRLARDLAAAAIEPGELPVAIDPAEFDADSPDGAGGRTADDDDALDAASPAPDDLPGGSDAGSYLHALFEDADLATLRASATVDDWRARAEVTALLVDKAREWNIGMPHVAHAARIVHATLTKPLQLTDGNALPPLTSATALARELEFTYPVPGRTPPRALVKGFIDALVAYDDELWVLDYKSDQLRGADTAAAARAHVDEHYMIQARLYALAADRMRGRRRFAGLLYTFVRYDVTVALRVDDATLVDWTTWLANLPMVSTTTARQLGVTP